MKKILIVHTILLMTFLLVGCSFSSAPWYEYIDLESAFKTNNNVSLVLNEKPSKKEINQLTDELNNLLDDLDKKFNSVNRYDGVVTEIMKVNNNSGIEPVVVSDEVIYVVKEAIKTAKLSEVDGVALFDPTIAPVWNTWDFVYQIFTFAEGPGEIPNPKEIEAKLPLVNYKNIIIDEENKTVFLKEKGMALDLGAIVKGYAADKVEEHLVAKGYKKAIIDIGGNIQLLGSFIDKKFKDVPWKVSIRTPYINGYAFPDLAVVGSMYAEDKTVVTSGVYEKYIVSAVDGKEYHHILDPRTGWPIDNGVVSITVITDLSITADALSTTLFAIGFEAGMDYVNNTPGLDCVYIIKANDKYEVYVSNGIYDDFKFNDNLTKNGYTYKGKKVN